MVRAALPEGLFGRIARVGADQTLDDIGGADAVDLCDRGQGVTVDRLDALIDAFGTRDRALSDTQSYREERKP